MTKNLIIAAAILAAAVLIWGVYSASDKSESATLEKVDSAIEVPTTVFDFGDIDIFGGIVETTYEIKNTGTEAITITDAITSCMCTEGKIDELTFGMHGKSGVMVVIPAGESKTLTAIYDPLAHGPEGVGPMTRELFLTTNSSVTSEIVVRFSGNVIK